MAGEARYGSLPFAEQIEFFRDKVNLPTRAWTDLWEGMHSRAFVVAGAMKDDLLADLRAAVDKAIADGATLQEFRRDFDAIVERRGWSYKGGRNWRTRVIYETNLRQSYSAGREAQMADPELRKRRPYGLYRHGGSQDPRPEHLAWDGLVLPLDDPWWDTHTPQNGWGCKCRKRMISAADAERMGLAVSQAPKIEWEEKAVGVRGPSPRTVRVPKGIDPGFAYNPGTAAWGRRLSAEAMETWQAAKAGAWSRLTDGDWSSHGRPTMIPLDKARASIGRKVTDRQELRRLIAAEIGGAEQVFRLPGGGAINVNAEALALHIDPARSQYLPFLWELFLDPFEVWTAFEQHKGTGQVVLRTRVIKAVETGKLAGKLLVAQARRGQMEAWTVMAVRPGYLQKQRVGMLVYGRE